MLIGLPLLALSGYFGYKYYKEDTEDKNSNNKAYNDLFKNMQLLKDNEWVKLKNTKREKAYNLFQFEICDSVSVNTFKDNVDFIAEKINAKDQVKNRGTVEDGCS